MTCSVPDCGRKLYCKSFCRTHYTWSLTGRPLRPIGPKGCAPDGTKPWRRTSLESKFFSRVDKTDGCWLWRPSKGRNKYGNVEHLGKHIGAHRLSWIIHHKCVPIYLWVLHRCDRKNCVNPEHLFLGTPADNTADMIAKGRAVMGGKPYLPPGFQT